MEKYLCTKVVEAEPAVHHQGRTYLRANGYPKALGLIYGHEITNPDGTKKFISNAELNKNYMFIEDGKVSKAFINVLLEESRIDVMKHGDKTTIVCCTLPNGFTITESSSCVDPNNYDELIGKEICLSKIEDKLCEFLGFTLQLGFNGFLNY